VPTDHLDAIRRDSAALLDAARQADPATTIDACPAWTAVDLVWHIGEVQHFWGWIVAGPMTDWSSYEEPARPDSVEETFAFAERSTADLVAALAATDPSTPLWTWSADKTAGFVARRMAHEAGVHRVDAERAAGREWRMPAAQAADGVDEFLVHFLPDVVKDAPALDGSIHVHCADVDGEWTVTTDDGGGYVVERTHAKGDAALRGDAHDLLMVLWRRAPLDVVAVFGDRAVAERLVARTNLE
jgi:uncharacterized protein (TIGR03083 family)